MAVYLQTRQELLKILKNVTSIKYLDSLNKDTLLKKAIELNLIQPEKLEKPPCDSNSDWIPLRNNNGTIIDWALIDIEDAERVNKYKWYLSNSNGKLYVMSSSVRLHTFILGKSEDNDIVIDHINHNALDNRKINLRYATRSLNGQNKEKIENTTSKYIGVYFAAPQAKPCASRTNGKWRAMSQKTHLGYFNDEESAAYAYDEYIRKNLEGGKLNEVEKPDGYVEYKPKNINKLPKRIYKRPNGKYQVNFYDIDTKFKKTVGTFSTIKEAEVALEKYTEEFNKTKPKPKEIPIPILRNNDGIAILPVTYKGQKGTKFALVDDDVWHELMKKTWYIGPNKSDYVCSDIKLHHAILSPKEGFIVDHIYSRLDNRRNSLRYNTSSGNGHHKKTTNSNGFKGLSKNRCGNFKASITFQGKNYCLGTYETKELAAKAYNYGAIQFYKENASINENIPEFNEWKWNEEKMRLIKI